MAVLLVQHLGAGNVRRHQVRRELDALEREIENLRHGLDQQRLRQARYAGDQAVPAGEEGHQDLVDDRVLADDDLPDLRQDALAPGSDPFGDRGDVRLRRVHQCVSEYTISLISIRYAWAVKRT